MAPITSATRTGRVWSARRGSAPLRGRRQCGFTLVELLIVIAIVGILVALMMPAIQQAREAARRIRCVNNLRQIAVGTANYESTLGRLPPAGLVEAKQLSFLGTEYDIFDQQSGRMLSWAVLLLPYLEERNLYEQFDLSRSALEQPNEAQAKFVPTLMCPSDSAEGRYYSDSEFTLEKQFAKGNYAAFTSPFHVDLQLLYPGAIVSDGEKGHELKKIIDGMSQTIAFSEVRTIDEPLDERGAWALSWNAASLLAFDMHHGSSSRFNQFSVLESSAYQTQRPNMQGANYDVLVRCDDSILPQVQLAGMPCGKWDGVLGILGYVSSAPRSLHPGGVNAAYLDGRVEFLVDDVDPYAMAYQISIDDQKVTDDRP